MFQYGIMEVLELDGNGPCHPFWTVVGEVVFGWELISPGLHCPNSESSQAGYRNVRRLREMPSEGIHRYLVEAFQCTA
jgi:hypothetical protein